VTAFNKEVSPSSLYADKSAPYEATVMIHNSKRRETCDYVYYYLGFTAAGNDSAGNRQRSGLYIGGNNEERKHRKEGVLEGRNPSNYSDGLQEGRCLRRRKVSWSSSTR
jgi:hypothetical protein